MIFKRYIHQYHSQGFQHIGNEDPFLILQKNLSNVEDTKEQLN